MLLDNTPSLTVGLLPRVSIMNRSETVDSHEPLRGSSPTVREGVTLARNSN